MKEQKSINRDIISDGLEHLSKHAGIFKSLAKGAWGTAKGVGGLGMYAAKRPALAVPAVLAGGAYFGVRAYKKSGGSRPNYNTHLRNNALAGNISAGEMSPTDLRTVRSMNLR